MLDRTQKGPSRRETLAGIGVAAAAFLSSTRLGWAAAKVAPITIVINQSPVVRQLPQDGGALREGERQQGRTRRQPLRGLAREAAQLRPGEPGPVRSADHELGLVRGDVFRRLRRGDQRHRPGLQARPGGLHARRHRLLRSGEEDDDALRQADVDADLAADPDALLPRRPLQGGRAQGARDLRRAGGERPQVPQAAPDVRHRAARARAGRTRSPTTSTPTSTATAAASSRTRPRATTRSSSTTQKGKAALDYYIRLAREAGHPKTAALDQAEVIQNMVTGKAAHIMMVIAAWSQMDDPDASRPSSTRSSSRRRRTSPGVPTAPGPRPLARRHRQERAGRPQAGDRGVSALVPDQGRPDRDREGRRHPDQRRRLPRPDRRGAQVPLDEAARRGACRTP